jgi:Fe-S cluster assembly protein SufD
MNAEVRQMKTAAELALAEAFAARPKLPGEAEIETMRQVAFRDFEARGLPHRRVEEWKYTDLRALMRDAKPLAPPPDAPTKARAKDSVRMLAGLDARRLVFADGSFVPELSDLAGLQAGLTIRPQHESRRHRS